MKPMFDLIDKGGLPILAIIALSIALYSRCFKLLIALRLARRSQNDKISRDRNALRLERTQVQQSFQQQRISLGAMIAAAPLLGLLGTVSGMAKTFESLGSRAGEKSMEGLARGISEVLTATEAGLAVAIPALALVFLAHREARRTMQQLNALERSARPDR